MKIAKTVKNELKSSYETYDYKVIEFLDLNLEYHNEENDAEDDVSGTVLYEMNAILR